MRFQETMGGMQTPRTGLELAGTVARLVVDRGTDKSKEAAAEKIGISKDRLYRIFRGDATVGPTRWRRLERAYEPATVAGMFDWIMDMDRDRILNSAIDPAVKQFILDGMDEITRNAPTNATTRSTRP